MKKFAFITIFLFIISVFAGCSNSESGTIKIGVSGTDTRVWDYVKKKPKRKA